MLAPSRIPSIPHNIKLPYIEHLVLNTTSEPRTRKPAVTVSSFRYNYNHHHGLFFFKPRTYSGRTVLARARNGDGASDAIPQQSSSVDIKEISGSSSTFGDSYVALFVQMLGLDYDPLDREQAIDALWKYSLGGKKCIDYIMQFSGCINLTVNLLRSESNAACEAAAGLLRSISSINVYRDLVAECGAIEEITGLLTRPSLTSEVKEQSMCTLWNLSVDEKHRLKIANTDILPLLIKSLEDDNMKVKEAAGGVLANLALSKSNHSLLVEAGVIPKLAMLFKANVEGSKVIRKEARNALIELAKDDYYRILIIEEGLVPVPMIGTDAYKSFRPELHSWPSLPDGTEIERTSQGPSKFGANELLLGLNVNDKNANIDEAKMNAMIGRSRQHFLARIGAIESEDGRNPQSEFPMDRQLTLLPWTDGVARLVLILGLEDERAIARAAESIADISINEHMRMLFKEAGAIKYLVQLLDHSSDAVRLATTRALERLSVSHGVCQIMEAEGVVHPLVNTLKNLDISENLMEKTLDILGRILDPSKEMKSKFYYIPVNGSEKGSDAAESLDSSIELTGNMVEVPISETTTSYGKEVVDSVFIGRMIGIMKTSYPDLQRKAASILEFITITDTSMDTIISVDIESGLDAIFQQKALEDTDSDVEGQQPEKYALDIEEASLAISAGARLLTKLLDSKQFCQTINSTHFTKLLRKILKSNVPLHYKDWVAAGLVKLSCLSRPDQDSENPINMEVTLYEAIPRLIEQIKSPSFEAQEAAVIELNRIISEGVVDSTRAVASEGGIFPLVKLIEEGSNRAVEAGLAILYNLSMDSENHSAIIAAGGVPALRRIVFSQRPQWTIALRLLRNLPV